MKISLVVVALVVGSIGAPGCSGNGSGVPQCMNPPATGGTSTTCANCLNSSCSSEVSQVDSACSGYVSCYDACDCSDDTCLENCQKQATSDSACEGALQSGLSCAEAKCTSACGEIEG
jgi:hypothetical protein